MVREPLVSFRVLQMTCIVGDTTVFLIRRIGQSLDLLRISWQSTRHQVFSPTRDQPLSKKREKRTHFIRSSRSLTNQWRWSLCVTCTSHTTWYRFWPLVSRVRDYMFSLPMWCTQWRGSKITQTKGKSEIISHSYPMESRAKLSPCQSEIGVTEGNGEIEYRVQQWTVSWRTNYFQFSDMTCVSPDDFVTAE